MFTPVAWQPEQFDRGGAFGHAVRGGAPALPVEAHAGAAGVADTQIGRIVLRLEALQPRLGVNQPCSRTKSATRRRRLRPIGERTAGPGFAEGVVVPHRGEQVDAEDPTEQELLAADQTVFANWGQCPALRAVYETARNWIRQGCPEAATEAEIPFVGQLHATRGVFVIVTAMAFGLVLAPQEQRCAFFIPGHGYTALEIAEMNDVTEWVLGGAK